MQFKNHPISTTPSKHIHKILITLIIVTYVIINCKVIILSLKKIVYSSQSIWGRLFEHEGFSSIKSIELNSYSKRD